MCTLHFCSESYTNTQLFPGGIQGPDCHLWILAWNVGRLFAGPCCLHPPHKVRSQGQTQDSFKQGWSLCRIWEDPPAWPCSPFRKPQRSDSFLGTDTGSIIKGHCVPVGFSLSFFGVCFVIHFVVFICKKVYLHIACLNFSHDRRMYDYINQYLKGAFLKKATGLGFFSPLWKKNKRPKDFTSHPRSFTSCDGRGERRNGRTVFLCSHPVISTPPESSWGHLEDLSLPSGSSESGHNWLWNHLQTSTRAAL